MGKYVVNVAEYRNRIASLERLIDVDYHAAAAVESAQEDWRARCASARKKLALTSCKRATVTDRARCRSIEERAHMLCGAR